MLSPLSQVTELVVYLNLHPFPKEKTVFIVLAECCTTHMRNPEGRGPPKPSPADNLKAANSIYVFSPYAVTTSQGPSLFLAFS